MTNKDNKYDKILVLKNMRTPEKIPAEWWKKLSPQETSHMRRRVIPLHGDVLSPRDRELLRSPYIIMKNGEIYRYTAGMESMGIKPKKLTPEEITSELLDRAENDRIQEIGEVPWWELEGISREEWKAKQAADKARRAEIKSKTLTRGQWGAAAKKYYGRPVSSAEIHEYMLDNETQEQRMQREYDEIMGLNKSSFRPGVRVIYDHEVNKGILCCIAAYVFYNYRITLYIAIVLAALYYVGVAVWLYFSYKRRARLPFVPDPKSRFTEEWQRQTWELDRKRWGYDKEDQKTK